MNNKSLIIILLLFLNACSNFGKKNSTMPFYGNYCGSAYPKTGSNPIPIDKTDLACKNHDKCYEIKGYLNQQCDEKLLNDLQAISSKSDNENIVRNAIIKYFEISAKN